MAHTSAEVEDNEKDHRKWMNPLETRLPLAPNLKIFCFYGVGKSTERSYFYREDQDPNSSLNVTMDTSLTMGAVDHGVIPGEGDGTVPLLSNGCKALFRFMCPCSRLLFESRGMLEGLITRLTPCLLLKPVLLPKSLFTDGIADSGNVLDMCAKGWHLKRFNPAGVKIKVYEMPHEPDRFSPRGGPNTGESDPVL